MLKKISVLALAGMLAMPAVAAAGAGGAASNNLDAQIAELTKQLEALKAQMNSMKKDQDAKLASIDERAEDWDAASRFQWSGDFRAMGTYMTADSPAHTSVWTGAPVAHAAASYDNDTIFTNRLRLNMRAKATENVEFKGRLAMYKVWGTQTTDWLGGGGGPFDNSARYATYDGATTRTPSDNILRVDRAFVNWNNIGGAPVWFSIGRRPTTDGPPAHLRMNSDERLATPTAFMDWPFDGVSVGYAYNNLFGMDAPGRVRFCWGRGFENGVQDYDQANAISDTDFAGISWDIYKKGDRFVYLQSFAAFNLFNYPDTLDYSSNGQPRETLGDLIHTSGAYMDKWQNLNYFVALGWSHTEPTNYDAVGYGILASNNTDLENRDGYIAYVGVRYDIPNQPFKIGAEYNHGTEYWIGMTPGHDDMYATKLGTRGDVYEVYGIWDIPGGEKISKYGKAFIRLGYQHYEFDYTGSGNWVGAPVDIDTVSNAGVTVTSTPVEDMDTVYASFEAYF